MSSVSPEIVAEILRECAEKYILPRYKMLAKHEISSKSGPRDLVTQADIDVEEHLKCVLPGLLPGSIVIGEESVSGGKASLDVLKDVTQSIWIVDPVDGTYNFVHHKPEFGIMLACVVNGVTQYGWIYDVLGERMAIAERGSGAFIGAQKLQVRPLHSITELMGHINPGYFPAQYKNHIRAAREKFKSCQTLNCAAHEYLRIVTGQAQFSVYSRLKPWDHLPGALMITETGGYVEKWDRTPYTPQDHHVGLIAAASQENWNMVYDVFLKNLQD